MTVAIKQEISLAHAETDMKTQINRFDWQRIERDLDISGFAVISQLISPLDCQTITVLYPNDNFFRSHIIMQKYGFGKGEYKYFRYPLPNLVENMRITLYPHLAAIANRWYEKMQQSIRFPLQHQEFIARCHSAGQQHPTPLLVRYVAEDYNCLHQDLYGEHVFPLQIVVLLAEPGRDFTGGDFVLTEQRPRMQSRVEVVPLSQGDAVIFAVQQRPVVGTRGTYRVNIRHGVSRICSGLRYTLGIIFHDAN